MPDGISFTLILIIALALTFDFINGFHDTANSIATTVSTRALTPRMAILMAACLNFVGALVSQNVAKTIANGILKDASTVPQYVIIAALMGAIIWNLITWYIGLPSSSSHAIIGALIGAGFVEAMSVSRINMMGSTGILQKVIFPFLASPVIGFALSYLFMTILFEVLRPLSQYAVNKYFSKLQILSAAFMAYAHGNNDAQKSMGIITMALISAGVLQTGSSVPIWVKIICAIAMALGTSIGGWKIIKTMGVNMIKLQPVGGFAAETAAALVIEGASAFGYPLSTTHVISSSIMGVGASKRMSAVRWSVARNIVWAWVFTIPVSAILGGVITLIIKAFIKI